MLTNLGAIIRIQKIFSDQALIASTFGNVTRETVKAKFSTLLNSVMLSMQQHLQKLQTADAVSHGEYVSFVQEIVSQIRSHCSNICPPLRILLPPFSYILASRDGSYSLLGGLNIIHTSTIFRKGKNTEWIDILSLEWIQKFTVGYRCTL